MDIDRERHLADAAELPAVADIGASVISSPAHCTEWERVRRAGTAGVFSGVVATAE